MCEFSLEKVNVLKSMLKIYPSAIKCVILAANSLNFSPKCPHSTIKPATFQ
jgi:hypothetical protein